MYTHRTHHSSLISILIIVLFISEIPFLSCSNSTSWQRNQGMIWNTVWHATYEGNKDYITSAIDSLQSIGNSLSVFDPNSLISRINRNETDKVNLHLEKVYKLSREINHISKGYFDPTVSPLIDAWGFGKGHIPNSDTASISSILEYIGIDKTRIENGSLIKDNPEISFNFSAIAKGYGVDMAAKALQDKGCTDLMFEIGGEVVCIGHNPEGEKWRILIETPDEDYLKEVFKSDCQPEFGSSLIVELSDEALATSGNYRNFHSESGKTFGHTISPITGRPVETDILSASVIAPSCMEADALATACMAMGSENAMAMLQKENRAGAFILSSGEVLINDLMKEHLAK